LVNGLSGGLLPFQDGKEESQLSHFLGYLIGEHVVVVPDGCVTIAGMATYSGQNIGALYKRRRRSPDISVPLDRGCDVSPSCFSCPLDKCLFDYKSRERAIIKANFLYQRKMAILESVIQRVMQRQQDKQQQRRRGRPR
jgi:hypothetical protein